MMWSVSAGYVHRNISRKRQHSNTSEENTDAKAPHPIRENWQLLLGYRIFWLMLN